VRFVDNNTLNGFTSDQERKPKITWADVDSIVKIVESRVNRELAKKFRGTLEANNPEEAFFSELTIQERKMVRNAVFHGIALPDKEKLALLRLIENAHVTSIAADNEPYYVNPLFAFASDKSLESSPQERLEKLKDPKSKGNLLFASAKNTLGITSNYSSIINPLGVQIAQGDYNIYLEKDSNKQYIWQNGEKLYLPKELYETKSTIDLIKKFNGKSFQLSSADTFRKHLGDWMHGTTKQLPVGSIYKIDDVLKGIEQYKLDHNAVRYYPIQIESLKNLNWLAQRVLSNKGQDDYLVIESFGEELYFKGDGQGKLVYNPASEQITTTDQVIGKSTGTSWATPNLAAKKKPQNLRNYNKKSSKSI
jgi:hypothetical protein